MMHPIDVSAYDIREYALSQGWTLVREALHDGLFVLNSPTLDDTQLIFPKDDSSSDYKEMAQISLKRLAEFYNKSNYIIREEIREVNDDVISLRYFSDTKNVNSLSFTEALESIEATKQMILAAGTSVVTPSLYHKRLSKSEAVELLRKTRFRHTQEGSFILKISCPIILEAPPVPTLFGEQNSSAPISRKAFELISNSALKLLNTVELDNIDELLEEQQQAEKPIISYNFCDSLVKMFDDERELPFELRFNWSDAYKHKLPTPRTPEIIRFPYSFKSKLEELTAYFKPKPSDSVDTFFGSVESLNGNEGQDGLRFGEVTLALLVDGQVINSKVSLNSEQYREAYAAHGMGGGMVKVKGKLLIGAKRNGSLENIASFETLTK